MRPDFTTVQRLDTPIAPAAMGSDAFFEFLFSKAPASVRRPEAQGLRPGGTADLHARWREADLQRRRRLQRRSHAADAERRRHRRGRDPQLKSTYVAFGAHYDHVGYADAELTEGRRPAPPGRVTPGAADDRIWNGADDDGSGTVALMALARAFAAGTAAEALAAVRLARRRRARACGVRATSPTIRPCRSTRSWRS